MNLRSVGVLGSGIMGAGIAEVVAAINDIGSPSGAPRERVVIESVAIRED